MYIAGLPPPSSIINLIIIHLTYSTLHFLVAASAIPPCLIATIKVCSKFGALGQRLYNKRIWLLILKIVKDDNDAVRELLRFEEMGINAACFSFRI